MIAPRALRARTIVGTLALIVAAPLTALGQATGGTPISAPAPLPTPVASSTPIPYPAYGSPAPDVMAQLKKPGIPQIVNLQQAVAIAAAQSPEFATQRAQYDILRAKYGAEQSAVLPSASIAANTTRNFNQTITTGSGAGNLSTTTTQTTQIIANSTVSELVFDGGRVIAGIRSAKNSDLAGRETLLRQLQTLAFNVATAYFNVLQAEATVDSDASLVREFETQEQNVRAQIRIGAAARSDLAGAEFQTAQARGQLVVAQGLLVAAQATFATTLGLDADANVNPLRSSVGEEAKNLSYTTAVAQALQFRPDYLSARNSVESAKENLRFAKLAHFPVITANTTNGYSRLLPFQPRYETDKSVSLDATIPIFDQGLTNFNVATAASQLDQANAALVITKLTVESDVRSALANVISARAALVQADAELRSAQVSLQATQAQYKVGASTITAIVTAEANLSTAQRDYVNAVYSEHLGEERYSFALGTSDLRI